MMKLSCRDMGADCDFAATGDTAEEVKKKMTDHAMTDHKAMMDGMSETEKKDMMAKMDEKMMEV
jgi:predicted small metal-binding protein